MIKIIRHVLAHVVLNPTTGWTGEILDCKFEFQP